MSEAATAGRVRDLARASLFPLAELGWATACAVLGATLRPGRAAQRWTTRGDQRVVVVAAHPDDETIGAGGVTALHTASGDRVRVVVVTDGGASRAGGLSRAAMVERRRAEVRAAAARLGCVDLVSLDLPEGGWRFADARAGLAPLVDAADVVYAPSCVDYHPEHVGVARVVADLGQPGQTVRVYQTGVPLTPLLVNLVADLGPVETRKAAALAAFATQRATLRALERLARYEARLYRLAAVELFWELPAAAYARVMALGDWRATHCPFRGIGPRPLGDPLPALLGLRARAHLRAVAVDCG